MDALERVNILLVDDQPAKLLSYEAMLRQLGENLIKVGSAREALETLLRTDVAVILADVCMPEMDGFEFAAMLRQHPRFEETPIIFVSAIAMTDFDRLRGYESGAVDYVSVPVVPEVLQAKVRVFVDLYRKTRQLERMNVELERRVAERTAELEASNERLQLAQEAGRVFGWTCNLVAGDALESDLLDCVTGRMLREQSGPAAGFVGDVADEVRSSLSRALANALAGDGKFDLEFRAVTRDGREQWLASRGDVERDASGRPLRMLGVTYDVSDRHAAQAALAEINAALEARVEDRTKELRQANARLLEEMQERERAQEQLLQIQKLESLGHLTGGVAHDFNNLLMAILSSLDLLKRKVPVDPKAQRLIGNAIHAAERGAALTQRMLAFARRQELRPEAVDVENLVDGMTDLLKRSLTPGIALATDFPDELWRAQVDPNQLELALLNLCLNARDAMPRGGVITIALASREVTRPGADGAPDRLMPGNYVCISVSDTGEGMDEATLARAAEPFFTTKGIGKGTGLGLSVVDGLTTQLGGAMTIRSRVGEGTSVTLWLRAAEEAVSPALRRAALPQAPAAAPCRILLVEDDPLIAMGTVDMLEDLGHEVVQVHSGREGLDILESGERFDLVITDHAMPGMNGTEFAIRCKASWRDLPVILATGYSDIPVEAELALPKLSKPYRQDELAQQIASLVRHGESWPMVAPARAARGRRRVAVREDG